MIKKPDGVQIKQYMEMQKYGSVLTVNGGDVMQSAIDAFNKANSVPQILKDRLGRYQFMPVRIGLKDCCGFVYHITGKLVK